MQCPDWIGIKLAKLASGIKLAIPVSRSVLNLHPAADPIFFWTYMLLPPILYILSYRGKGGGGNAQNQ
jgi:hypothetical protein